MSRKPLLYLHIGTHKTGTTSIQKFAAKNRKALRKRGVFYPPLGAKIGPTNPGHHHFAHALSDEGSPSLSEAEARDFVARVRDEVKEDEIVLLSAEPLYRHVLDYKRDGDLWAAKARYAKAVVEALDAFEVVGLLVFRRLDEFSLSLYKESVLQSKYTQDYARFLRDRGDTFRYLQQAGVWEQALGPDNLRVHFYEDSPKGPESIRAFFQRLDVEVGDLLAAGSSDANISVDNTVVELKRLLNMGPYSGRQNAKLRLLVEMLAQMPGVQQAIRNTFVKDRQPFDEDGVLRKEMEAIYAHYLPQDAVEGRMADWPSEIGVARARDAAEADKLCGLLLDLAQVYFSSIADNHLFYGKAMLDAGLNGPGLKAIGRALEFEPKRVDVYREALSRLSPDDTATRKRLLRNAAKEIDAETIARELGTEE